MVTIADSLPPSQDIIGIGGPPNNGPQFFPFPPNWKHGLDETLTFKSWVLTAEDGSEQSGSINGDRPRREIEYRTLLKQRDAQRLENMVFAYQSRTWMVAHWGEGSKLNAPVAANAGSLALDTTMRSFAVTGRAVIFSDPDTWEIVPITGKTDNSLILGSNTQYAWPAGTKVYPVFYAFINASLQGKRHTDSVLEMPVSFLCDPNYTHTNTPPGVAAQTYRGVEVYRGRLNWINGVSSTFSSDVRLIDLGASKLKTHSASRWTPNVRSHQWLFKTRAELFAFRQWLGRREGMARPCWMESGMTDFTVAETPIGNSQYLRVLKNSYGVLSSAHPARRDILIKFRDGTSIIRRITGVTQYSATADQLILDSALPAVVPAILRVAFLNSYRMSSPSVTIRYHSDEIASCEANLTPRRTPLDLTSTTMPLPGATQGSTYNFVYSATGGLRPYTWTLASGSLPPGLTLTSTGRLTGIPSNAGSWTFTVSATDIEGQSITVSRTLTVAAASVIEHTGGQWSMSSAKDGLALANDGASMRDANVEGPWGSNTGARTWNQPGVREFIRVDLGAVRVVKHVTLGGGQLPSGYNMVSPILNGRLLQYSNDNLNWTTRLVISGITDTGQLDKDFTFPETQARYWRIAGAQDGDAVGTATFRLFGFNLS